MVTASQTSSTEQPRRNGAPQVHPAGSTVEGMRPRAESNPLRNDDAPAAVSLSGLPARLARVLADAGYSSLEQVRAAIHCGVLGDNTTIGIGPRSFPVVCKWAGIDPLRAAVESSKVASARRLLERLGYRVIAPLPGGSEEA